MRGRIIHYNSGDGKGLAAANDQQYPFDISQWRSESAPAVNQVIELQLADGWVSSLRRIPDDVLLKEKASEMAGRLGGLGSAAMVNLRGLSNRDTTGVVPVLARLGKPLIAVHALFALAALFLPFLKVTPAFGGMQRSFTLTGLMDLARPLGSDIGGGALPWLAILSLGVPVLWPSRWSWVALLMPLIASLLPIWNLFVAIARASSQASAFDRQIGTAVANQLMKMLSPGLGLWLCLLTAVVLGVVAVKRTAFPPA